MTGGTCIKLLEQAEVDFGGIAFFAPPASNPASESEHSVRVDSSIHDNYGYVTC